ncbi:hypothetical protein L6452_31365 [Arctium lappa]|uniref:Uncharacterized protein n=1 Tax=Arctium lappa TaxID=4217 RepID=A0ACB8Z2W4_ARCLA|nr:hypothetical protein L6452_31365 [Arctium lappa]
MTWLVCACYEFQYISEDTYSFKLLYPSAASSTLDFLPPLIHCGQQNHRCHTIWVADYLIVQILLVPKWKADG